MTATDQGQGGAQGIALASAEPKDVETRLRVYEDIRRNRASVMQIFSNAGQEEPELIREEASKFIPADRVPSKLSHRPSLVVTADETLLTHIAENPEEFFAYNFGYDIIRDSVQQVQKVDASFELPASFFQKAPGKCVYP